MMTRYSCRFVADLAGLWSVLLVFMVTPANKTGMNYLSFAVFAAAFAVLGGRVGADTSAPVVSAAAAAHSFSERDDSGINADGALPLGGLTDGGDGYFYGAASVGGAAGAGTVFRLRTDGTGFAVLHSLAPDTEGSGPTGTLTVGGDGQLYGTTSADGPDGAGTVFRLGRDGAGFTVLHSFDGGEGGGFCPAGVTAGGDGFLYGVAGGGDAAGSGTVFRVGRDGAGFATLHTFTGEADGSWPLASLTVSGGVLYGTTFLGGASLAGTVFRIAPDGSGFATLYAFMGNADGAAPAAALRDGGDGFLYGAALSGGDTDNGTLFRLAPDGSGFAVLHSFDADTQGSEPLSVPRPGAGGLLYGTAYSGGPSQGGTAYSMSADGTGFTVLAAFSGDAAGELPGGALLTGAGGRLYGTAYSGGAGGQGAVFFLEAPTVVDTGGPTGGDAAAALARARVLWTTAAGAASLWTVEDDGTFAHSEYGPFPGWTAAGMATGPDGATHLLWRSTNGMLSLWNVDAQGGYTYQNYGPYAGWSPRMISADADGGQWVVWTHTSGQVSVWRLDAGGVRQGLAQYGPFPGWSVTGLASGPKGSVRLTWTHAPDGQMSLWELNPDTFRFTNTEFGPFGGWSAGALAIDADGGSRAVWTQASGQISLWTLFGQTYTHAEYGPFNGWRVQGEAAGNNSPLRLLWTRLADGLVSLWSVDDQGQYTYRNYGPYSGWSAVSISVGP